MPKIRLTQQDIYGILSHFGWESQTMDEENNTVWHINSKDIPEELEITLLDQ